MKVHAVRTLWATSLTALGLSIGLYTTPVCAAPQVDVDEAQSQSSNAARGEAALAEGREHLAAGRWSSAKAAFEAALNFLPANHPQRDAARVGLDRALTQLEQGSIIGETVRADDVLGGQTLREFQNSMVRARELIQQRRFEDAEREVLTAQINLTNRRAVLGEQFGPLNLEAEQLRTQIRDARRASELQEMDAARKAAESAKMEAERQQRAERERIINENLRRVRQLQAELKYDQALQVIGEILFLDPQNPAALVLNDAIIDTKLMREISNIQYQRERGYSDLAVGAQRAAIPPQVNIYGPGDKSINGIMVYPADWPDYSLRRTGDRGYMEAPEDRAVYQKLETTTVPVNFADNTFEQVINYFSQVTGEQIYVDWNALNFIGVTRDSEVNLQLNQLDASRALDRVLEQLAAGDRDRPQWTVQDGLLTISSDEALRKRTVLIVYDIRDLLFQVPMFDNAPELDLESALNQGNNQGGGGGGGGGGGFGGGGGGGGGFGGGGGGGAGGGGGLFGTPGDDPERLSRAELVKQIVDIIQENIDPDGWRDLGGDTGSLQELNGNLIITNTPRNHRAIEGLLSQLREIRALQINVESRFMTVATDWFEQIGVDLDLYFNTNNTALQNARAVDPNFHLSDFFNSNGTLKDPVIFGSYAQVQAAQTNTTGTPGTLFNSVPTGNMFGVPDGTGGIAYTVGPVGTPIRSTSGFAPIGVTQDSLGLIGNLADFASDSFAGVALANPALTVGIQFLDDVQVDLLIQATQADRRSVVLTAPRLTFFNGQRAWIAITTQTTFVSGLTPVTGAGSAAFQPQISTLNDGFVLDVEGVISSDRRYVTMTVIFDFAEFLGFRTSSASEFGGAAGGGGTTGGSAAAFTGRVELPVLRGSRIRTTVSVPDRGTVLLGGQRRVEEIEVETGVPVLSKIPFINRFFTNRVTSKSENTLLILIRPEIIIQQENEDMLFPGLSDSLGGAGSYLR